MIKQEGLLLYQNKVNSSLMLSTIIVKLWKTINNQSIIPSTDVTQLTLTLKMTTAQVVETSVTVNNNSPIQDYVHPDDQTQPIEMTPGFKPFTKLDETLSKLETQLGSHIYT